MRVGRGGRGWDGRTGWGHGAPPVSQRLTEAEPTGRRGPEVPSQETNWCLQGVSVAGGPRGKDRAGVGPESSGGATDLEDAGWGCVCGSCGPSWALPLEGTVRPQCGSSSLSSQVHEAGYQSGLTHGGPGQGVRTDGESLMCLRRRGAPEEL